MLLASKTARKTLTPTLVVKRIEISFNSGTKEYVRERAVSKTIVNRRYTFRRNEVRIDRKCSKYDRVPSMSAPTKPMKEQFS